jgi:hypothetical protein
MLGWAVVIASAAFFFVVQLADFGRVGEATDAAPTLPGCAARRPATHRSVLGAPTAAVQWPGW